MAPFSTVPSVAPLTLPYSRDVPSRATFELFPGISLGAEYSSNFNETATGAVSNVRVGLSPSLTLAINGAATQGIVGYTLSATHDTSDGENNLFHAFSGQVSWRATPRLILTIADSLSVSDQASQADTLGLRTGRDTFTSNTLAVTADYFFPTVATRAYYRLGTFSGLGGTTNNAVGVVATTVYETNVFSAGYEYLNSRSSSDTSPEGTAETIDAHQLLASFGRPLTSLLFGGVGAAYYYASEDQLQGGNFQIVTLSVLGRYAIPGRWLLNGSIGLSQLIAESQPNRITPAGSGTLSYLFPNGVATIGYSTGFSPTFALGQDFGVVDTWGVTAGVSYSFTPSITGFLGAYYRNNTPTGVGGGVTDFNENSAGGSLGLGIQLLRWLNLGLGYSYTRQTNPVGGAQGFSENRAFISLNAAF